MNVHYKIEPEDIKAAQKNAVETTPEIQKRYRLIDTISPIILLIFLFLTSTNETIYGKIMSSIVHTFFWWFVIIPFLHQWLFELIYWIERKKLNEAYIGQYELNINENEITINSKRGPKTYRWEDVLRVEEDEFRYFFYLTDNTYFLVKKKPDNLSNEEQKLFNEFIQKCKKEYTNYRIKVKKPFVLPVPLRIILLVIYVIVFIGNPLYQSWTDPLNEVEDEVYDLFESVGDENVEPVIKKTITREQIDNVRRKLYKINDETNPPFKKRSKLVSLVILAEEQYLQKYHVPNENTNKFYSGESENWKVEDYGVEIIFDKFRTIEGKLSMKNQKEFIADFFQVDFELKIYGKKKFLLLSKRLSSDYPSVTKSDLDIVNITTGDSHQFIYLTNKDEEPLKFEDIEEMGLLIQWKGQNEETLHEERIPFIEN